MIHISNSTHVFIHAQQRSQVFRLDWIQDVGAKTAGCAIDLGSPENFAASDVAREDAATWPWTWRMKMKIMSVN